MTVLFVLGEINYVLARLKVIPIQFGEGLENLFMIQDKEVSRFILNLSNWKTITAVVSTHSLALYISWF